jgi:hypothetical protein
VTGSPPRCVDAATLVADLSAAGAALGARSRHLPGRALSRAEARPADAAHVVVDHDDVTAPVVLRWMPN